MLARFSLCPLRRGGLGFIRTGSLPALLTHIVVHAAALVCCSGHPTESCWPPSRAAACRGGANLVPRSQQRPRGVPGHRKAVVQVPAQRGHLPPGARVQHHRVRVVAHHRQRGTPRLHACIVHRPGEAVPAAHREAVSMMLEADPCLAIRQVHSVWPQLPLALRHPPHPTFVCKPHKQ